MSKSKKKSRVTPAAVAGEPFFADRAKEDIAWWRKTEPLKHEWQGYWSRRITAEHRLVYRVEAGRLYILQARYHY